MSSQTRLAVFGFGFGKRVADVDYQCVVADASARQLGVHIEGLAVVIAAGADAQRLAILRFALCRQ